jgi:thymidylate synthase (FAD)
MDSHAQYEIRVYAEAIYELIKPIVPLSCEAFEDYVVNTKSFSAKEMEIIRELVSKAIIDCNYETYFKTKGKELGLSKREQKDLMEKIGTPQ